MAQQQQPQLRWQIQSYYRHSASTSLYTEHPASEVAIICDGILVVSSASTLYECHDLHQTNIKLLPAASNSAVCVVSAPLTGDGRRRVRRFKLTVAEPRFLTSLLEAAAAEGKRRPAAGQLLSSPTPESMCLLLNLKLCDPGFKATSTQTDNTLVSLLHNTAPFLVLDIRTTFAAHFNGLVQVLFLLCAYFALLSWSSEMISDGSELLLLVRR